MPMKKITFNALLNHKAHNYKPMQIEAEKVITITKKSDMPRLDMCYRRYLYIVDKNEVLNASKITFNDTSSRYGDIDEKDVVNWFNTWCDVFVK